jgi:hypothetical protein
MGKDTIKPTIELLPRRERVSSVMLQNIDSSEEPCREYDLNKSINIMSMVTDKGKP